MITKFKLYKENNSSNKDEIIENIQLIIVYSQTEYITLMYSDFTYNGNIINILFEESFTVINKDNSSYVSTFDYEVLDIKTLTDILNYLIYNVNKTIIEFDAHDPDEIFDEEDFNELKKLVNLIGNNLPNSNFYEGTYDEFLRLKKANEFNL